MDQEFNRKRPPAKEEQENQQMTEKELFIESHRALIDLVKLAAFPVITVKNAEMAESLGKHKPGSIYLDKNDGVKVIHHIDTESQLLIIDTFCESHKKLNF
jgi:hypothetical protein